MTFSRYYKFALSLPLLFGAMAIGLVYLQVSIPGLLLPIVSLLSFGALYYGPRYALFAAIALIWSWSRKEQTLRCSTLFLPVAFVPFMFLELPSAHGPRPLFSWSSFLHESASDSLLTLATGYAFVVIAWALYGLLSVAHRRKHA
jgi:hypothetical protein